MKLDLGAGPVSPDGFTPLGNVNGTRSFRCRYADGQRRRDPRQPRARALSVTGCAECAEGMGPGSKAGRRLRIAVPDFGKIAEGYVEGRNQNTQGYVMGGQTDAADFTRFCSTARR
jgi:hypothetical protein